ncbi:MAG: universal stress protein [Planctomycetota bacterium]
MQRFNKILFVGRGTQGDSYGLIQAISLAREYGASLTAVHVCPELPGQLRPYTDVLLRSLDEKLAASVARAKEIIGPDAEHIRVGHEVGSAGTPVLRIIQLVLQDGYDLLVKEAEPSVEKGVGRGDERGGFRAFDMQLLRKCPCAVWLCRPIERSRADIRVGVAIDPSSHEAAGHELSLELLRLGQSIAGTCSHALAIISCWSFEYEEYLFESPWSSVPHDEVRAAVAGAQRQHRRELDRVIAESGINGAYEVHHVRGHPAYAVPHHAEHLGLDILVMGTVARTGIPGLFIGNTAENIMQKLGCSLVATKPPGFVSPVRTA